MGLLQSAMQCAPALCHISAVTCQVSGVTFQVSGVKIINIFLRQNGGASCWWVCYQWGLPRLVDKNT